MNKPPQCFLGSYTTYFTFKDVEIDETVPLCLKKASFRAGAAVMFSFNFFGCCLFLDLLFVFLTDVRKLTGFENKKSQINCFFHDRSPLQK